jgi:hypothetical protein
VIAYATDDGAREAAAELFELLKVPAQPFERTVRYECVISNGPAPEEARRSVLMLFSASPTSLDTGYDVSLEALADRRLTAGGRAEGWNLLTPLSAVETCGEPILRTGDGRCVGRVLDPNVERYGFDLFREIAALLAEGQNEEHSLVPALELHLELLRSRLRRHLQLVEIPPLPFGHNLVVGLSHDIDSLSVAERCHGERWLSLIRQSTVWPLEACLRGRADPGSVFKSWQLAATSPLIRLGAVRDPWDGKVEEYMAIERAADASSTYFFIPYPGRNGYDARHKPNHRRRAAMYDLSSNRALVQRLSTGDAEIGVHGIDAWHDVDSAVSERERVSIVTERAPAGVRMHYLYLSAESFRYLDAAGFAYDSTFGYPRDIGMRPGTLQPYRPIGARSLLELPVALEDTGLMSRVGRYSRPAEAVEAIDLLLEIARRFGGALIVSWHDHSLSAPRFWRDPYLHVVMAAHAQGAWTTRLADIATWFRLRRGIQLSSSPAPGGRLVEATVPEAWPDHLPPARIRVFTRGDGTRSFHDIALRPGPNQFTLTC